MQRELILLAHNLRSCHNVGSLLRTAEGLGVREVILTGYTPYPETLNDTRMAHEVSRLARQIHKTALGAEHTVCWRHEQKVHEVLAGLKTQGYEICALEQDRHSTRLPDFRPPQKTVIIVGREVEGLEPELLAAADTVLEIPMFGSKESFNVVQAAAMALYHCRFGPRQA